MQDNEMIYDVMREFFNISVGKAADMLSDIVGQKILLNVPNAKIIDISQEHFELEKHMPRQIQGALMVSSVPFQESFTGTANLIFPAEKMKEFVHLCMQDSVQDDDGEFTDIDFDILKEIGNIILNCIMGEIANSLDVNFVYSLPEVRVFDQKDFCENLKESEYIHLLMLYITFRIGNTEIEGAVLVNLTLNSLNELLRKLNDVWGSLS